MAKVWNKRKSKIQNEEANVELIAPYAAPAPKLCKIKLSLILLVLIVLRLIMLGIFCLPWSIHNLIVIYHPRKGVGRNLYWGTGLSLEALFEPVKFTGGYNTDRFREVISYIYIADCSFHLIVALVGFFTVNLKTIMVLCIIWLIWGLMSLGVFVWGFVRFALRKQFLRMIWYYVDFGYIFFLILFLFVMICSVRSIKKHGYISLPAISMIGIHQANIVVPKANPDDAKSVTIKDDKDLAEIFSGNVTDTPTLSTTTTTTTTSMDPSPATVIQSPNPNQKDPNQPQGPGNFGPYGPYGGPYGQYPPPPYGQGPYGQYPPGPYGYPPNFQQQQQQQQAPATPTPEPSSSLAVPRPEQIPERSREVSIAASTLTTTTATAPSTSVAPTPQNPNIISVGPNPYELQAMLERLMPKEREREREQEKERPTGSNFTEITISRKKKKKDKKKKKKKSKHKKRK